VGVWYRDGRYCLVRYSLRSHATGNVQYRAKRVQARQQRKIFFCTNYLFSAKLPIYKFCTRQIILKILHPDHRVWRAQLRAALIRPELINFTASASTARRTEFRSRIDDLTRHQPHRIASTASTPPAVSAAPPSVFLPVLIDDLLSIPGFWHESTERTAAGQQSQEDDGILPSVTGRSSLLVSTGLLAAEMRHFADSTSQNACQRSK